LVFSAEFILQVFASELKASVCLLLVTQFYLVVVGCNAWFVLVGGDPLQQQLEHAITLTRHEFWFLVFLMLQLIPGACLVDSFGL
jgi:hypothetical protein